MINQQPDSGVTIVGVPFDATSTYKPGSRFAPNAIREAFKNVEVYSPELDVDLDEVAVQDDGDLPRTSKLSEMLLSSRQAISEIVGKGRVPAALGGEHSITLGTFSAFPVETALLVFDAHFDCRERYDDLETMHATFLRRIVEVRPGIRVIHVGARAATRDEWHFAREHGFSVLTADQMVTARDPGHLLREALRSIDSLYVSIDLDAMDPAYAPGAANPEVGGLSSRQMVNCLRSLRGVTIAGFDIVELCPPADASGITAVAAARMLSELCMLVYVSGQESVVGGQ